MMADKGTSSTGLKWSRNLREETITEANRVKLIQRQKMILESKRQRQPQVVSTSQSPSSSSTSRSRVKSPSTPSSSTPHNRSFEHLLELDPDYSPSRNCNSRRKNTVTEKTSSTSGTGSSDSRQVRREVRGIDNPSVCVESLMREEGGKVSSSKKLAISSDESDVDEDKDSLSGDEKAVAGDSSPGGVLSLGDSEDDEDEDDDEIKRKPTTTNTSSDKRTSDVRKTTDITAIGGADSGGQERTVTKEADRKQQLPHLNPLTTILNNSELLEFVTEPVSPQQVFQCTIIRDKRASDKDSAEGKVSDNSLKNLSASVTGYSAESPKTPSTSGGRQVFLLCGRRRKKSKTYLIGLDPFDISRLNCVSKLKSNVIGTQFRSIRPWEPLLTCNLKTFLLSNVSNVSLRAASGLGKNRQKFQDVCVLYDANVLGFKGPRKMTVFISSKQSGEQMIKEPMASLFDGWKHNKNIIRLKNKTPVWNEDSQSYVLNFHGRVTQASVKNFQLIQCFEDDIGNDSPQAKDDHLAWDRSPQLLQAKERQKDRFLSPNNDGESFAPTKPSSFSPTSSATSVSAGDALPLDPGVCMQFGRVSDKEFTCDITHPLSPLQAFAIALSSFDSKLACE